MLDLQILANGEHRCDRSEHYAGREYYEKEGTLLRYFADVIPLGRMGTPRDIYHLVEFLCSNKSAYITGQNITIDGGYYLLSPESLTRKYARK